MAFDEADNKIKDYQEEIKKSKEKSEFGVPGLIISTLLLPGLGTIGYIKYKENSNNKKKEIEKK